jgi:RNA polymerase sigma-70 factor (ECF subfamily)
MDPELTQPSLLSRVRDASDHAAWREFEGKYRELVLRYARARGLQQSDAEDVRQIVMMNLAKRLPEFDYQPERGRFRDYLGRVTKNAVSRHFARPNAARAGLDSAVMAVTAAPDSGEADALWEREWVSHHYRLAMRTIRATFDPRSVEVFDRLLSGDAVDTIAESEQMSAQAVHKVKQRVRDRLREIIAAQIAEEDRPDG